MKATESYRLAKLSSKDVDVYPPKYIKIFRFGFSDETVGCKSYPGCNWKNVMKSIPDAPCMEPMLDPKIITVMRNNIKFKETFHQISVAGESYCCKIGKYKLFLLKFDNRSTIWNEKEFSYLTNQKNFDTQVTNGYYRKIKVNHYIKGKRFDFMFKIEFAVKVPEGKYYGVFMEDGKQLYYGWM